MYECLSYKYEKEFYHKNKILYIFIGSKNFTCSFVISSGSTTNTYVNTVIIILKLIKNKKQLSIQ